MANTQTREKNFFWLWMFLIVTIFSLVWTQYAQAEEIFPQRVSIASDGSQGNEHSGDNSNSISADGRYVAFESLASNLVSGDTNNAQDIFVRDRVAGVTQRVNIASDGSEANNHSEVPVLSLNGRYVAFPSEASNLVPNDTNARGDIFVHDRVTGATERVNVASDGSEANDRSSQYPSISADGRYIVFWSYASNLVQNDTNADSDVFVRDRVAGLTKRVSVASDGSQGNSKSGAPMVISADGRYVVFYSNASNLVANDTNAGNDIFIHDLVTSTTERVVVTLDGSAVNPQSDHIGTSTDFRYLAFVSNNPNLVPGVTSGEEHTYVHDRVTGQTILASVSSDGDEANSLSYHPSLSADGRYVTFESDATNLVPNAPRGVFVHDLVTGITKLVSVAADGSGGNGGSSDATLSPDGRYIAFGSAASNLVSGDTNGVRDSFVTLNPLFVSSNQPPILDPIGNKSVDEGQLLQFTITATDPDNNNLTYSAVNLPPGATFDSQTATFSWTPGYNQAGNYPDIEFTVTDDGNPIELDVELINITVGNVNRAPVFNLVGSQEVLENKFLTFTVNAADPDGDDFTLSVTNLPSGASFNSQSGIFSWTPNLSQEGVYVVTFEAADDGTPVETGSIDVVITVGDNPTPTEQAENLVNTVITYSFPANIENSYLANLKKVEKFIEEGKINAAINQLQAFIDKVENDYAAGIITQAVHDDLIGLAENLLTDLE